ncbi:MAG: hypothetical protein Q7R78_02015 [bacterium]|nr:hypothetical protein [bacterium]
MIKSKFIRVYKKWLKKRYRKGSKVLINMMHLADDVVNPLLKKIIPPGSYGEIEDFDYPYAKVRVRINDDERNLSEECYVHVHKDWIGRDY